jgi:hypothetical protein
LGKCNECGLEARVVDLCDVGNGYECETCYSRGIEEDCIVSCEDAKWQILIGIHSLGRDN